MRSLAGLVLLISIAGMPVYAYGQTPPTCEQFMARLATAEKHLKIPLPAITYEVMASSADSKEWQFIVSGLNGDIQCERGSLEMYTLEVDGGSDPYTMKRAENLMIASIWAYTNWPLQRSSKTIATLVHKTLSAVQDNKTRGKPDPAARESVDLTNGAIAHMDGGGSLTMSLWIDASAGNPSD